MAGMPVYGIISAHFEGAVVTKMVVGPFNGSEMLARVERKREWLLEKLRDGLITLCTVKKNQDRYQLVNSVNVLNVNGQKYLRIDQNLVPQDFLGDVREF